MTLEFFVALRKPERASWLVEKLTEMGVRRLCWVMSERAPREAGEVSWSVIAESRSPPSNRAAARGFPESRVRCPGSRLSTRVRRARWCSIRPGSTEPPAPRVLRAWIGPEGGFTTVELADLESRGSRAFSLGPRILRIETAAVAAAARLLAP